MSNHSLLLGEGVSESNGEELSEVHNSEMWTSRQGVSGPRAAGGVLQTQAASSKDQTKASQGSVASWALVQGRGVVEEGCMRSQKAQQLVGGHGVGRRGK